MVGGGSVACGNPSDILRVPASTGAQLVDP